MEFFDKKEEVIDIKLTQFGRHLLSKGKFLRAFISPPSISIWKNIFLGWENLRGT